MIVDIEQPCILKGGGVACARREGLVGCRVSVVEFTSKKTTHAGEGEGGRGGRKDATKLSQIFRTSLLVDINPSPVDKP